MYCPRQIVMLSLVFSSYSLDSNNAMSLQTLSCSHGVILPTYGQDTEKWLTTIR